MLQFITNTNCSTPVEQQVKEVLEGGCKWIQIRMKEASDDEVRCIVKKVKPLCDEKEAFLILNDRVELAKELEVSGVHLGKNDMSPGEARMKLGAGAIIGVTANTIGDIERFKGIDIDYIGIGPFRETSTKENLAPILGLEGIKNICEEMRCKEIVIPRVAVGGIGEDDIDLLMHSGVNGVAISGAIANANDIKKATEKFLSILKPYLL